jgi:phospholipase C
MKLSRYVLPLCMSTTWAGCCDDPMHTVPPCEPSDSGVRQSLDGGPKEIEEPAALPFDDFAETRGGCGFGPGATTVETIGPRVQHGSTLPFDHILVLLMENRSFDHYFAKLNAHYPDADVATEANTSRDPSPIGDGGVDVPPFHETRCCVDSPDHEWTPTHLQYNRGRMDGFIATNEPEGEWVMGYYDESDIPYHYWLAKTFATSDRHFASLLGPTWPNRFFFFAATSWGRTFTPSTSDLRKVDWPAAGLTIFDQLAERGLSSRVYYASAWPPLVLPMLGRGLPFGDGAAPFSDFQADVLADALPAFAFIEPNFRGDGANDDHPPTNMQLGQAFVEQVVSILKSNTKVWNKSVLFITYDEHGGFYDHVPPPAACVPDEYRAADYAFDRLGIRVPLWVVSPFARRGYMSHFITDLTSITRFVQNRFDLGAMTARDANAWPLLDMFDFDAQPQAFPANPPEAQISAACRTQCADPSSRRRGLPPR